MTWFDVPWSLDSDTTIKPLCGQQEGAVVSYNLRKPGRPAHSYHTYLMARLRLVLGVEVKAGNEHSGSHTLPGLLRILDELPAHHKPKMVRGDCGFGSDGIMRELEARTQPYLFKLRLSKNVKRHIERLFRVSGWRDAGQGWEGIDSTLALTGWEDTRRVVVLRRPASATTTEPPFPGSVATMASSGTVVSATRMTAYSSVETRGESGVSWKDSENWSMAEFR